MTDPTERALALASEVCPCVWTGKVPGGTQHCGNCTDCRRQAAVARVIQGVMDERDALKRELEHERQRLAAVGVLAHSRNEAQLAGMLPEYESDALAGVRLLLRNLLDAIEETP